MKIMKLIAMTLVALLALPMGAAVADIWATKKFTGDDDVMQKVRIDHAPRNLFLQTKWKNGFYEGDIRYWLDTRKGDPGPEFLVRGYLDEFNSNGSPIPGITLRRVEDFGKGIGKRKCAALSGFLSDAGHVNVKVPRHCLTILGQQPMSVRLSVGVFFAYGGPDFNGSWAWSPRKHRFGPWVARN
jgi:hypothetical protein